MKRKEEIILATLELASQNGLGTVSLSQIADKLGIRKPSLYNHFKSKDEIVSAMYQYLREKAKEKSSLTNIDYGAFVKEKSLEQALMQSVSNYNRINEDEKMVSFYKVIYSERATNPIAAKIMVEETKRMILATKNLFYALKVHGKISCDDIDMAATSFAMAIHAMMDYQIDCTCSGEQMEQPILQDYISWFSRQYGGEGNDADAN